MSELNSTAGLVQMSTGYRTTASGISPAGASPFQGLPIPGGQGTAQIAQMLLGGQFQQMMSRAGMTGMGLGHDQNVYDRIQAQSFQAQMQGQLRDASELDRSSYMNTMQGVAALAGVPFGGQQRLAAGRLADLAVNFAPMLAAYAPDTLDKLSGSRGSAVVLAQRLAEGGRYRLDPVTGQMGVDPKSAQNLTKNIMQDLYSDGNLASMKGISAGQLGGVYEQLSLRGLLGGAEFGREGLLRNITAGTPQQDLMQTAKKLAITGIKTDATGKTDLSGISAKDLDLLTKDDGIASKLRDFDANKIKTSLKSYVGAISAMRDIFGDAGKPNAPIPELMQALEGLTSGSMGQVSPQRLGQMARQTYYLAKSAGISADNAMVIQQDAAARGQQLGIESPFSVLATQSSLGYNAALRSRGALATPSFGGMTEGALTQANSSMFQQGVASQLGTRIGTLRRLEKIAGPEATKNSDLGAVLEAINTNRETVKLSDGRELVVAKMTNQDVEQLGATAKIDRGVTQDLLRQKMNAREALLNNPNDTNYIRTVAQNVDINETLSKSTGAILTGQATRLGVNNPAVAKQLESVSTSIIKNLSSASLDTVRDSTAGGAREAAITKMLDDQLPPEVKAELFKGKSPQEQQIALKSLASQLSGNLDVVAKNQTALGTYANIATLMNPSLAAEGSARQLSEGMRNEVRDSLSGVASGSALRNAIDALKGVNLNDPNAFEKVIAKTFGGVDNRIIGDALRTPLSSVVSKQKEVEDIQRRMEFSSDPVERKQLAEKFTATNNELKKLVTEVVAAGESVNAYSATGLSLSDTASAKAAAVTGTRGLNNIAVIRANDTVVSKEQREAARAQYTKDVIARNTAIVNDTKIEENAPDKILARQRLSDIANNKGPTLTDAQADRIVIDDRRSKENQTVRQKDIDDSKKNFKMTTEAATDYAMALRDQRMLGIEDKEIDAKTNNSKDPEVRKQAIRELVEARGESADPKVIAERTKAFRKSADSKSFLETQSYIKSEYANVTRRAQDPSTIAKFGVGLMAQGKELQTVQQEQQNLIDKYADGDIQRFMTGDNLKGIENTPEGRKEAVKVIKQYEALTKRAESLNAGIEARLKTGPVDFNRIQQLTDQDKALIDKTSKLEPGKVDAADTAALDAVGKRLNINVKDLPTILNQANTVQADYERYALGVVRKGSKNELVAGSAEEKRFKEIVSDFGKTNQLTQDEKTLIDANAKKLANSKQIEQLTDQDKALIEKTSKLEPGKVDAADKAALDVVAKRLGVAATDLPTILTDTVSPADKPKLAALASRIGGTVADLPRIRQLGKDVTAEATKESELLGATSSALATRLADTFKLSGDPNAIKEIEGSLNSSDARSRAATMIGVQDRLTRVAGNDGKDTATLQKDYDEAIKTKNFDSFKTKYQLTNPADFDRTVADLGTYGNMDVIKFKGEKGAKNLAEDLKVYGDSSVRGSGKSEPLDVKITGSMTGEFKISDSNLTSIGGMATTARSTTAGD